MIPDQTSENSWASSKVSELFPIEEFDDAVRIAKEKAIDSKASQSISDAIDIAVPLANRAYLHASAAMNAAANVSRPHNEPMSTMTREELDAKLDAVRADMRASSADVRSELHAMRAEFQSVRADYHDMRASVSDMRVAVTQDIASASKEVASLGMALSTSIGEIKGSLDGVKTGLMTVQWLVGSLLAAAALYVAVAQFNAAPPTAPPSTTATGNVAASQGNEARPATASPASPAQPK